MSVFFRSLCIWAGLVCTAQPLLAQAVSTDDYVAGEVVVQWKQDYFNVQSHQTNPISVLPVVDVAAALQTLRQDPHVVQVEPNYKRYLNLMPDDADYVYQLHLEQTTDADIDVEDAWDTTTGDRTIVIAVIDSGVDIDHPDLIDNIWTNSNEIAGNGLDDDANGYIDDVHGWDFIEDDNDPNPTPIGSSCDVTCQIYVLHGTHVAGIIGATGNNTIGVTGVNWKVSIMPLRIFTADGTSTTSAELEAIAYAQANGATVINMSYGGYSYSLLEAEAIADAYESGLVSVAAAGNDIIDLNATPSYPVCNEYVLGVGAVDENDATASFSNYGSSCVDVAAPGVSIYSTFYTNDATHGFSDDYGYLSGTSMSTPVVSGILALLWSADATITPDTAVAAVVSTTDAISDTELGSGRVNAANAVYEISGRGLDAVTINAYTGPQENKSITAGELSVDPTPYFTWDEPASVEAVSGYYVYFGTDKADPIISGTLQTENSFSPTVYVNDSTYHLRIKAVDVLGQTSKVADFTYDIDTKVNRPVWRSIKRTALGARLRWYRSSKSELVVYYVYRSRQRFGHFEKITSQALLKTSYLDKKVLRKKHYYYKIRAIDYLGNQSILTTTKRI